MTYAPNRRVSSAADSTDALIYGNLQLVRRLAWHMIGRASASTELEELVQAGMIALIEAARTFEDRGFEFSTYASIRIKGAMIDHLRRASGKPRGAAATRRAIDAARSTIESVSPGRATAVQIAERLGVSLDAYYRMETDTSLGVQEPLDEIYADDSLTFSDDVELQDAEFDRGAMQEHVREALGNLDQRSQLVLQLYFFEEMNLEEIGQIVNVSAARICQIKSAALKALKSQARIGNLQCHFAG